MMSYIAIGISLLALIVALFPQLSERERETLEVLTRSRHEGKV
jgi:hypothetical protein